MWRTGWGTVMVMVAMILEFPGAFSQIPLRLWRDTLCQNSLRINYTPQPFIASVQTPPVYDFIGSTMVQVYSGIAAARNDTNLSFTTLVNGFGNLSLMTCSPIRILHNSSRRVVYYSDFFSQTTGTIPNQAGIVDEILGTVGLGINNSLLLRGDLNKLSFLLRYKLGACYGRYPGLLKYPHQNIIFFHCFQFRIRSTGGAIVFDFPVSISEINVKPVLTVAYYQRI